MRLKGLEAIILITVISTIGQSILKVHQDQVARGLIGLFIHLPLAYFLYVRMNWARIVRVFLAALAIIAVALIGIAILSHRAPSLPNWFPIFLSFSVIFELWVIRYLLSSKVKDGFKEQQS